MASNPLSSPDAMSQTKEIVEKIPGLLTLFSDGSVERVTARNDEVDNPIAPVPASQDFVDGVATRDVEIDPETGAWARIYLPETITRPNGDHDAVIRRPIVIHYHGGGFCTGSPDWRMYYSFYTRLVKQSGVLCVSFKYRLAPEHRLPTAYEDAFGCVLWVRSVARGEREDPWLSPYADFARCYLVGESAGGNLVHEAAIRAGKEDLHPLCLRGGVLINPGFARERRRRSEIETPYDPSLTAEMMEKFTKLALPEGCTKDHPIANPLATALQDLKLPPVLVAISEGDMIRDTQSEYCEAMKNAGKSVEVLRFQKVGHCFHVNYPLLQTDPNVSNQRGRLLNAIDSFIQSS